MMKEPCFVHYGNAIMGESCLTVRTNILYPVGKVKMADGTRRVLKIDPCGPDYVIYKGNRVQVQLMC